MRPKYGLHPSNNKITENQNEDWKRLPFFKQRTSSNRNKDFISILVIIL